MTGTKEMRDLSPCPFCGGEAAIWTTAAYSGDSSEHVIGCEACDIKSPFASVFESRVPSASDIAAWNRRAPTPEAADLIHEREAHAETQAALRAFIADLDRANAAFILAKDALTALVDEYCDYATINLLGDPERQHNIKLARAALDAINKLGVK